MTETLSLGRPLMASDPRAQARNAERAARNAEALLKRRRAVIAFSAAMCILLGFVTFFLTQSKVLEEASFLAMTFPVLLQIVWGMADLQAARKGFVTALPYLIP